MLGGADRGVTVKVDIEDGDELSEILSTGGTEAAAVDLSMTAGIEAVSISSISIGMTFDVVLLGILFDRFDGCWCAAEAVFASVDAGTKLDLA